jgi:hypothetical protein
MDYELYGRSDLDPDEILRRVYAGEYDLFSIRVLRPGSDNYDFSGFTLRLRKGMRASGYDSGNEFDLSRLGRSVLGLGGKALDFATSDKGILALLLAGLASGDRRPAYGGGTRMAMPVAPVPQRMAAQGGLMQAYRQGGSVRPFPMQDGGFVMTKRAVDGAGGPRGIGALLPAVRPIRGPGTGTSDSIPATIRGRNGVTPAKVSNGEAYVPPQAVRQAGGAQQMYALMNRLQRRA